MFSFIYKRLKGRTYRKFVRAAQPVVAKINAFEKQYQSLSEEQLRAKAFGVTSMDVHGRDADHIMLLVTMKRKRVNEAIDWLQENCSDAVITVSDIKTQRGGFLRHKERGLPLRNGK